VQTLGAERIFTDYNDAAAEATPLLLGLFWLTYMNVNFGRIAAALHTLFSSGQANELGHTGEMFVWIIKSGIYVYLRSWGGNCFPCLFLLFWLLNATRK
jgi:hypothetical protein